MAFADIIVDSPLRTEWQIEAMQEAKPKLGSSVLDAVHLSSALTRFLSLSLLLMLSLALGGCGLFRADAAIGPDLKPRLGTSISLPLGK